MPYLIYIYYGDVIKSAIASHITSLPFVQVQIKENIKARVTGLYEGNSSVTGEFPTKCSIYAENVFIWWRHHEIFYDAITSRRKLMPFLYNP